MKTLSSSPSTAKKQKSLSINFNLENSHQLQNEPWRPQIPDEVAAAPNLSSYLK
jgi:hypothetical protein